MGDIEHIKQEVDNIKRWIEKVQSTQSTYVNEHHKLEKQIVEMRTDLHYIRQSQETMTSNLNKVLFIIGGGFIAAIVSFIVGGGLLK